MDKNKNLPIHYKELTLDIKAVDSNTRVIKGYAAIWGKVDSCGDLLVKGCCDKSLQERGVESQTNRKILLLNQHRMTEPLGKPTVLKSDDTGLYFECPIDDIQRGNEALTQIKSGTINQVSIGFNYVWDKCEYSAKMEVDGEEYEDVFIVKEIILWEISLVSFGMNEYTSVTTKSTTEEIKGLQDEINEDFNTALKQDNQVAIKQAAARYNQLIEALTEKAADKRATAKHEPQVSVDELREVIKKLLEN